MKMKYIYGLMMVAFVAFSSVKCTAQPSSNYQVGQTLPNFKVKGVDGKEIDLSSLKGKYVLVDFWASWCRPCRMESPYLTKAYATYNKSKAKKVKGFEIFSVSLDKNADAWKKAIKDDQLTWLSHGIIDPKDPNNVASLFNISFIPQNYLIDQNGVIIAKNLRGEQVEEELKKVFSPTVKTSSK